MRGHKRGNYLEKKKVIKKTIAFGMATLASRLLGYVRELLLFTYYLGPGLLSDAFATAYRLPNSLRKVFAEGAFSASLTPALVHAQRTSSRSAINSLMFLALLFFEGIVLIVALFSMLFAKHIVYVLSPGFSEQKIAQTIPMLRILMPLLLLISTSALFASVLQSINHFFIPAIAPVLFNIIFISSIGMCMVKGWSTEYFCYLILIGGIAQLVLHIVAYFRFRFSFEKITCHTWNQFLPIIKKFLFCFVSAGLGEIGLIVDSQFSSFLKDGSMTLLQCATRYVGLPLGIFATAFATIMLPQLSRISSYAPKRLNFFLLEIAKLVVWVMIPATILIVFFSEKIFYTLHLSSKFNVEQAFEASSILSAYAYGIFALSLNKMLLNIFYARHITWIPAVISVVATAFNIGLNFVLMQYWQAAGIAAATTITATLQMFLLLFFLYKYCGYCIHPQRFISFIVRYSVQLLIIGVPFYALYRLILYAISIYKTAIANFFLNSFGFWLWVGPLCAIAALLLFFTRKWFKITFYFLDE